MDVPYDKVASDVYNSLNLSARVLLRDADANLIIFQKIWIISEGNWDKFQEWPVDIKSTLGNFD